MLDKETIERLKVVFESKKVSFSENTVFILNSIIVHFNKYFLSLNFEDMRINCISEGNIMSASNQLLPTQLIGKKKSNIITFNNNDTFILKGIGLFDSLLMKQKPEIKAMIRLPEILCKYHGQFEKKITTQDSGTLSYFNFHTFNNMDTSLNFDDNNIKNNSIFSKINYDITLYDYNKEIEEILNLSLGDKNCITYIIERFVLSSQKLKNVFDKILLLESTMNIISNISIDPSSANAISFEINNKKIKDFINIEEMIKMMALQSDSNEYQALEELQKLSIKILDF